MKNSSVKKKPIKHLTIDKNKLKEQTDNIKVPKGKWSGMDKIKEEFLSQFPNPDKIHTDHQELENRKKYGSLDDDTIARAYRHSKETGDVYCAFTAEKYITRFISKSVKANNNIDLKKAIDYLQRMIKMNVEKNEVIEK